MTLVPGWTWQTMHWLVGIAAVKRCSIGWPGSFFGIVGSGLTKLSAAMCRTWRTGRNGPASGRWRRSTWQAVQPLER